MTWELSLTGLLIGLLVGITGMGGGSLMTPILILVFGFKPTLAVGTDILHGAVFKTFGAVQHRRLGTVHARMTFWMFLGSGPMSLAGVQTAEWLQTRYGDGVESASAPPDGSFLVLGNGAIGLLTAVALRATLGVKARQILMTGHHWDEREAAVRGLATPVDEDGGEAGRKLTGRVDVAFECVGGESNDQTLSLAVDMLRPGGKGVLFGPSEAPLLFDTRKVIAKGLNLSGCNRALLRHFAQALDLARQRDVAQLLERVLAPKEFAVESTRDLDEALQYAWTKHDAGRAMTVWS